MLPFVLSSSFLFSSQAHQHHTAYHYSVVVPVKIPFYDSMHKCIIYRKNLTKYRYDGDGRCGSDIFIVPYFQPVKKMLVYFARIIFLKLSKVNKSILF